MAFRETSHECRQNNSIKWYFQAQPWQHPCPTASTRDAALAACATFQGEQIPAYLAASPFLQKQAVLAGELGATSWISSKKPGHKATGRSIKGINFLGSYRPSGNNSILISAFPCAGEECRQHPQSHTFPKHLFPRKLNRYYNQIL